VKTNLKRNLIFLFFRKAIWRFYPVSAVLANNEIMNVIKPGNTDLLWWKPVAAAVAIAALEVVKTKSSVNAQRLGEIA
jgi:ornithine--oxo-acid transaminase